MNLINNLIAWATGATRPAGSVPPAPPPEKNLLPNELPRVNSEAGSRATPENELKYLYRVMWVDPDTRQAILDVRNMDRVDGRTKRIHSRIARDVIKGGLVLTQAEDSNTIAKRWEEFQRRLQLDRIEKLKSDARGLVMEGNLPMQWVLDASNRVVAGIRMPSETILPNVGGNGRYKDVAQAHFQFDVMTGMKKAIFPLWQLTLARFDPDNFDDMGSLGRPFLDASRSTWRKLLMTEEDLVIRRRTRAPQRFSHVLEGASKDELEDYRKLVEGRQGDINTDFYSNKKGGVTALQGDAALNQIEDVSLLLDAFFSGSPLPKGLMGYTTGMARDIFADLKEDYFDEIDVIQDTLAWIYDFGFRLDLMLAGINPDDVDYEIKHAERRTETPNQAADRGLKWRALGLPYGMVWEQLGLNPADVRARLEYEKDNYDPYPYPQVTGGSPGQGAPGDGAGGGNGTVKITPGNAPKGESATNVPNDVNRLAEEAA